MKKLHRIISIILIIFMLASVTGCGQAAKPTQNQFKDYYEGIDLNSKVGYLVKDGLSNYKIVIPSEFTQAEKQSAMELAKFVQASSGVILEIIGDNNFVKGEHSYFSIGRTNLLSSANFSTDYNQLNGDGFVIKTLEENIIIDAAADSGFLYGTYDFMEKILGVRFISHDEIYIPPMQEIPVYKMDVLSVPAFRNRVYMNYPVFLIEPNMEYAAHSRTNYDWLNIGSKYGSVSNVHSRGNKTHNARFYVPADKYGSREIGYDGEFTEDHDPHPELWWIGPGREPIYGEGGELSGITLNWLNGITKDGKLDESMEISTAKVVIEELKKDAIANPLAEYFVIEQEDIGNIVPPEDPTVLKYTASGVLVRFLNVVATELQKWADAELSGRKLNIVTFAYQQTQPAPVKKVGEVYEALDPTVIPVDNLYIRLAFTSHLFYPYNDARQPVEVRGTIEKWSAICKNFWFWGYDAVYTDYVTYCPSLGQAYGTVQWMREIGVQYFLVEAAHNAKNDWQGDLKAYVWNKLLWNPDQNVAFLVDEYINGYYGKTAGKYVKEMLNLLDTHYSKIMLENAEAGVRFWPYGEITTPETLTPQLIEKAISIIEEAEKVIDNSSLEQAKKDKILVRLARVKLTPKWMQLKYFSNLYPLADQNVKIVLAQEVLDLSVYGDVVMLSERDGLAGYLSFHYGV